VTRAAGSRGFTLMELLLAAAVFSLLGVALVTLLAQGMGVFTAGTEDTSVQDRFQALWPLLREDLAAMHPGETTGVPPPLRPREGAEATRPGTPTPSAQDPPRPPAVRLRSHRVPLLDSPADRRVSALVAAWVRTNAREGEDPLLRDPGAPARGVALKPYDPAAVDSGERGNLLPTGGLLEVAWVALPAGDDAPGVFTLYRCFRAPVGIPGSLLDVESLDTAAEIRAAGRPVAEGVLHFSITWRNVFAADFDVGPAARLEDGQPYAGLVWDSTRGDERVKEFAAARGKDSFLDERDDVFPAGALVELALAAPAAFGWRAEATLARPATVEDTRLLLVDVEPLVVPGPPRRHLRIDDEWMAYETKNVNLLTREIVVSRGQRGTPAAEHREAAPVFLGTSASTEVLLTPRDRYVRRR
jgi:prepilin-type N-terminal cleavage/methylation domain-containing protein